MHVCMHTSNRPFVKIAVAQTCHPKVEFLAAPAGLISPTRRPQVEWVPARMLQTGALRVHLLEGVGLKPMDKNGLSDPFVRCLQ